MMDEWMELRHRGRNNYTKPQCVFLNDEEMLFLFCDQVLGFFYQSVNLSSVATSKSPYCCFVEVPVLSEIHTMVLLSPITSSHHIWTLGQDPFCFSHFNTLGVSFFNMQDYCCESKTNSDPDLVNVRQQSWCLNQPKH